MCPQSLLVFDHLTRTVALLHDGSEAERQSLRREVVQALRGAVPVILASGALFRGQALVDGRGHAVRVRRAQEYIAAGDVYQLVLASRFEGRQQLARSRCIERCGCSIPRRICIFANSAISRWRFLARKRW